MLRFLLPTVCHFVLTPFLRISYLVSRISYLQNIKKTHNLSHAFYAYAIELSASLLVHHFFFSTNIDKMKFVFFKCYFNRTTIN